MNKSKEIQKSFSTIISDSMNDYLSADGLSASKIKKLIDGTPREFLVESESKETASQTFGTAVHMAVQEPELFHKKYFSLDAGKRPNLDKDFRNAENKAWRENQIELHKGKIDIEYFPDLCKIQDEVFGKGRFLLSNGKPFDLKSYFSDCLIESSFYSEKITIGQEFNFKVKARPDFVNLANGSRFDIKTTKSIYPANFCADALKFGYHYQEAFHCAVIKAVTGINIGSNFILAIQNAKPYDMVIYTLPQIYHEVAQDHLHHALKTYEALIKTSNYLGIESMEYNGSTLKYVTELPVFQNAVNKEPNYFKI